MIHMLLIVGNIPSVHIFVQSIFFLCMAFSAQCRSSKWQEEAVREALDLILVLSCDGLVSAGRIRLVLAGRIVCTSFH